MAPLRPSPLIAIAAGGTGGHLFPGMAVAEALQCRGLATLLLVSPKAVDQHAARTTPGLDWVTLPAVGLQRGRVMAFAVGLARSYWAARGCFSRCRPAAVLAMGGFTSAPAVLGGRFFGLPMFLHEANAVPGRANRWLAPWVNGVFVAFPAAAARLRNRSIQATGMPVRAQFRPLEAARCRAALGLVPDRPVVLVTGGSQGAAAINDLVLRALPLLPERALHLQFLHLTGPTDAERARGAYTAHKCKAVVHPFLSEMELALGAATVAVSRAGASSLAELAAMQVPPLLIPYPAAADNHQFHNARALAQAGAARLLEQSRVTPGTLAQAIFELTEDRAARTRMIGALGQWSVAQAADRVAEGVLEAVGDSFKVESESPKPALGDTPLGLAASSVHPPEKEWEPFSHP